MLRKRVGELLKSNSFRNSYWLLTNRILSLISAILVGALVARYLGPTDYGTYIFLITIYGFTSMLSKMGLDAVVIKDLVNSNEKERIILGSASIIKLVSAILFIFLTAVYTGVISFKSDLIFYCSIILSLSLLFQSLEVIDLYYKSRANSRVIVITELIVLVLSIIYKLSFVYYNIDLVWFIFAYSIELILKYSFYVIVYRLDNLKLNWVFDFHISKDLLKRSWPLLLSAISFMIYLQLDRFMIFEMLDERALGLYGVISRISEASYFIPTSLSMAFYPRLIQSNNDGSFNVFYPKYLSGILWIGIGITFILMIISKPIIYILFGNEYLGALNAFRIHLIAGPFMFLGIANAKWFNVKELNHFTMYRNIIGALINIVLNFIFIPIYGIEGAAFSTLVSYSFATFFSMGFFKKSRANFLMSIKAFNPKFIFMIFK